VWPETAQCWRTVGARLARESGVNLYRPLRGQALLLQIFIVLFELTVKRFPADLSFFNASVICTQLERNNKSNIEKGRTP
jgi:hypothetical protein